MRESFQCTYGYTLNYFVNIVGLFVCRLCDWYLWYSNDKTRGTIFVPIAKYYGLPSVNINLLWKFEEINLNWLTQTVCHFILTKLTTIIVIMLSFTSRSQVYICWFEDMSLNVISIVTRCSSRNLINHKSFVMCHWA